MYVVPQYEPRIRLIAKDGTEDVFDNYEEFLKYNNSYFVKNHVVTTFRDYPEHLRGRHTGIVRLTLEERQELELYIVRDEFGRVFSADEIIEEQRKRYWKKVKHSWFGVEYTHHVYRQNPVPYTGKSRYHFACYYRKPQTTQEQRWNEAHQEYVRSRRHPHNLPNAWDDWPRGDIRNRKNWKQNRKTQWK